MSNSNDYVKKLTEVTEAMMAIDNKVSETIIYLNESWQAIIDDLKNFQLANENNTKFEDDAELTSLINCIVKRLSKTESIFEND